MTHHDHNVKQKRSDLHAATNGPIQRVIRGKIN